ncbi:unnamed protein product [Prunus armeniaca]|uniref:Ribosomal RNA-processing protein 42 n=1 Tax=Prunus armeniaca TaxID=36596 RepID=A0A6J5TEP3_PRUAR|nr:unnamed protein product [Prunus armeniaca]
MLCVNPAKANDYVVHALRFLQERRTFHHSAFLQSSIPSLSRQGHRTVEIKLQTRLRLSKTQGLAACQGLQRLRLLLLRRSRTQHGFNSPEDRQSRGIRRGNFLVAQTSQTCYHSKGFPGAGIDLSSLVVVEGKICWDLYIDGLVVSSDGNLLDALGAAIKAALNNTGIPKVNVAAGASGDEQPEVDISDEEFLQFDTSRVPVIVTLTKVGRHYIVDATSEEESQMSSAVSISINRQGHICGLTKRGGAGLDPSIILDMISVAKTVSEQLINTLDSHIAAAEAGEEES